MRTFQDLIRDGIAPAPYKKFGNELGDHTDPICRQYNNLFGAVTDTHMSMDGSDRVITGQMVARPDWDKFLYMPSWSRISFAPAGYPCLAMFLSKNGLCGRKDILNGDTVYRVYACDTDSCGQCCTNCVQAYTTSESTRLKPVAYLTKDRNASHFNECWDGSLMEVADNMNKNINIIGEDWTVFDNNLIHYDSNNGNIVIINNI